MGEYLLLNIGFVRIVSFFICIRMLLWFIYMIWMFDFGGFFSFWKLGVFMGRVLFNFCDEINKEE